MTIPELDPPAAAATVFGDRLPLARRYVERLATDGIAHGLIGPREVPRLWARHVLNCAALADALPPAPAVAGSERVVDVGSGAGLPGLVLALCRPDLRIDLVEPMQRRCQFLTDTVADLGLSDQVRIVRGRADDKQVRAATGDTPWVTARAVAPLDRLVRWCLPLLRPGGALLAMKGASAESEVAEHRAALAAAGAASVTLEVYPVAEAGDDVVRIVRVVRRTGGSRLGHPRLSDSRRGRNAR